jgi:hypothetical protein
MLLIQISFRFDMSTTNKRMSISLLVILLISLFILIQYDILPSSSFAYLSEKNGSSSSSWSSSSSSSSFKPTDNGQVFTFPNESPLIRLYLDVVRDTVCGLTLRTQEHSIIPAIEISGKHPLNLAQRLVGDDWPSIGITMIGQKRLMHIEWALRFVIANNIPGDFIECGVWRGGASIFAHAILKAFNSKDRHVWLVDSFQGLPKARTTNDNNEWAKITYLNVLISFLSKTKDHFLFI